MSAQPERLRIIAREKTGSPFWEGRARQALEWAADIIEAAQKVIDERNGPRATAESK